MVRYESITVYDWAENMENNWGVLSEIDLLLNCIAKTNKYSYWFWLYLSSVIDCKTKPLFVAWGTITQRNKKGWGAVLIIYYYMIIIIQFKNGKKINGFSIALLTNLLSPICVFFSPFYRSVASGLAEFVTPSKFWKMKQ